MVSSSTIRSLVASGKIADAAKLLGHTYRVEGAVVAGARRGQQIGFPTANITGIETLLPADGVYAGLAAVGGREFAAAINIGPNPTFHENARKVEVHLVDRVRDVRKFGSRDELVDQIRNDVAAVRTLLRRS
jgi:riboflavin kinase/FMN adenylyltransferase